MLSYEEKDRYSIDELKDNPYFSDKNNQNLEDYLKKIRNIIIFEESKITHF